jgi:transposase
MAIVADRYLYVTGVDTHARTHTLAIVEANTGRELGTSAFPSSPSGHARAAGWLRRRCGDSARVLVVMEGTNSYGATLRTVPSNDGYRVVEAPKPARSLRRSKGKSDELDAVRAAHAVLRQDSDRLTEAKANPIAHALRILLGARQAMTRERTASINMLLALLRTFDLGIDARRALTAPQVGTVAAWRCRTEEVHSRIARTEAVRLARRIRELEEQLKANLDELTRLVRDVAPELLAMRGVGAVSAAVILSSWSQPGRIRSEAALASLAGTCPLPASSGNTSRHRLNRSGDRQLNRAMHTITLVRMNHDLETKAYVQRRMLEGRTKKEIMRSLKRYVTRQVYRTLTAVSGT